jgi:6-phosphogluconolactonase
MRLLSGRLTGAMLAAALVWTPGIAGAATLRAYIGTFTPDPANPTLSRGNRGEGIYLVDVDAKTGAPTNPRLVAKTLSPSWMTLSADHKILYTVNEIDSYDDSKSGSVSAYAIDPASGGLTLINTVKSEGAVPTYISLHPSGKFLMVANYVGGSYTVLPIKPDGGLAAASDVIHESGRQMPSIAADSLPGNFIRSDHRGPRGHMIHVDPSARFVVADDAGLDRIVTFRFDPDKGKLTQLASFESMPGSAPRHFVFDPSGRRLYQIQEQDSMLSVYDFDSEKGTLTLKQKLSALPPGFAGTSASSELLIDRAGRHLYSANRVHDSITTFAVDAKGHVTWQGTEATQGQWPRSLTLDPSGRFLYSLNQHGDNVTTYRIDPKTGMPHFTGSFLPIPSAAMMLFVP